MGSSSMRGRSWKRPSFATVAARLFDEMGVYGQNPVFGFHRSKYFPAGFRHPEFRMAVQQYLPGRPFHPLLYLFLQSTFWIGRVALLACFFLAVSHYLINFSKIGYVSLQALFALSLSLAVAAWAARSGRTAAFALGGRGAGDEFLLVWGCHGRHSAGFSFFYSALRRRFPVRQVARGRFLACGFGMLCLPAFFPAGILEDGFRFYRFRQSGKKAIPRRPRSVFCQSDSDFVVLVSVCRRMKAILSRCRLWIG